MNVRFSESGDSGPVSFLTPMLLKNRSKGAIIRDPMLKTNRKVAFSLAACDTIPNESKGMIFPTVSIHPCHGSIMTPVTIMVIPTSAITKRASSRYPFEEIQRSFAKLLKRITILSWEHDFMHSLQKLQ